MTECETYMLCQSNDPLKFNSSGCWKRVIFPLCIMKKKVWEERTSSTGWRWQIQGPADQEEPPCLTCSTRCLHAPMKRKWRREETILKLESNVWMSTTFILINGIKNNSGHCSAQLCALKSSFLFVLVNHGQSVLHQEFNFLVVYYSYPLTAV